MAGKSRPHLQEGLSSYALLLAVYAALCLKPMNKRDLTRHLRVSQVPLARAVRKLLEHNVIVQQADKKYRVVVMLVLPEQPKGEYPQLFPSNVEAAGPQPLKAPTIDNAILRDAIDKRPVVVPEPQKIANYVSERAQMLGQKLRMPASNTLGELNTGPLGRCACGASTPFRYGNVNVCPICARK